MKLLVKFELKFLNFFTLKNLNNKKIYFLLPKKQLCTAVGAKIQMHFWLYKLHKLGKHTTSVRKF